MRGRQQEGGKANDQKAQEGKGCTENTDDLTTPQLPATARGVDRRWPTPNRGPTTAPAHPPAVASDCSQGGKHVLMDDQKDRRAQTDEQAAINYGVTATTTRRNMTVP